MHKNKLMCPSIHSQQTYNLVRVHRGECDYSCNITRVLYARGILPKIPLVIHGNSPLLFLSSTIIKINKTGSGKTRTIWTIWWLEVGTGPFFLGVCRWYLFYLNGYKSIGEFSNRIDPTPMLFVHSNVDASAIFLDFVPSKSHTKNMTELPCKNEI